MSDADTLRLSLMRKSIDEYENKRKNLGRLVADLESLLTSLDDCPGRWVAEFREHWGVLEEVYSVAVVREQPVDDTTRQSLVLPAISRLRELIVELS